MVRQRNSSRAFFGALLLAACGSSSGPVLEQIKKATPPGSNLRVDVFMVRDVQSCAVGDVCRSADLNQCFTLSDAAGPRLAFRPDGLLFVPPESPLVAQAEQSGCFRLTIDDAMRAKIEAAFAELRQQVFDLSAGEINLGIRLHDIGPIDAGFKRWDTGIFLQPAALQEIGLPLVGKDTDFVFSVTGGAEASSGLVPRVDECAGSNWLALGGFGGTAYTWADWECATPSQLLWHFLWQSFFAVRDVIRLQDVYRGDYPGCGNTTVDPSRWFPAPNECRFDPDAPTCGDVNCTSLFVAHVLSMHWPKGSGFVGNHCRNEVMDYDEDAVDSGGTCDLIGR